MPDSQRLDQIQKDVTRLYSRMDVIDGMDKRLREIENKLCAVGERCPMHFDQMETMRMTVYGSPGTEEAGLVGRVAQVEQCSRLYNWGLRALWGLMACVIVAIVLSWFTGTISGAP